MKKEDQEILDAIRSGRDEAILSRLYSQFLPKVKRYILKNNGNTDEAHDIFQDAVLIFYKQVKSNKFKEEYAIESFIYSVSRNLWINYIKRKNRSVSISEREETLPDIQNIMGEILSKERAAFVRQVFETVGDRCKKLLMLSVFDKRSMKDICRIMGFATENGAKTQKYKCKQKLIQKMNEHPLVLEILKGESR